MDQAARGRPSYVRTLPRLEESAAAARRLTEHALSAWGLDALVPDASLVITELVANAVRHTRGESLRVVLRRNEHDGVEISVADGSCERPVRGQPEVEAVGGRGLQLVEAFAADWGSEPGPNGKRVWAEVRG
ncbi:MULTISPECIES: ATP-binding protein [Streptomyces]|uniref:ATP-binding protein n=1 Tax=Streptomyces evansiae TaxID=3075535 RepID=A0ABU2R296_9ACTN|nr:MULTISPECIES: ATP-binding protein [unclassified Streptomyces]MDT0410386.1 ATP-binding protein [Streptomyces sp. DSM 41979]MDT0420751.1 ATP-binding protein [Streptomyces sp. DSM 41859]MYQ57074.1 ATP-binding protein [Streptomyces sp. SID4926]WEH27616.1 ATP-binding protein [Streptomyces sp. AM 3-1-1]